jgi:hypothetical protein
VSYDDDRNAAQLAKFAQPIDDFIRRCRRNTTPRPTLFLFPGGMASRLARTKPPFDYPVLWLNFHTLLGDAALRLWMAGDVDKEQNLVVADGVISILGITPYDRFLAWCEHESIDFNWFVFGWDWRRRLDRAVRFFLDIFLPHFQKRVVGAGCRDPLNDFFIVGHSFGGMVVKLIVKNLDAGRARLDGMRYAVTVATPLYGYGGQVHGFFEGEPYLNTHYGTETMTHLIASLLGPYALMFLDEQNV